MARRIFTSDTLDFTPDSPVVFSPQCHLELVVGLQFLGASDSPACGTGQSGALARTIRLATLVFISWTSLDFHNVFPGSIFLTISPFLVIDDNTTKSSKYYKYLNENMQSTC